MVSAQERLTRTFTRSSHTYTRTERTEISKMRGGETKREVRVEESTQMGGSPFRDVFGEFLNRESISSFGGIPQKKEGKDEPLPRLAPLPRLPSSPPHTLCRLHSLHDKHKTCFHLAQHKTSQMLHFETLA